MFFLQKSESYFNSHTTFRNDPLFSLFVFCFSTKHYSQKTGIKGVVVDNTNGSTPKVVEYIKIEELC